MVLAVVLAAIAGSDSANAQPGHRRVVGFADVAVSGLASLVNLQADGPGLVLLGKLELKNAASTLRCTVGLKIVKCSSAVSLFRECGRGCEVVDLASRGFDVPAIDNAQTPEKLLTRKLKGLKLAAKV